MQSEDSFLKHGNKVSIEENPVDSLDYPLFANDTLFVGGKGTNSRYFAFDLSVLRRRGRR